MCWHPYTPGPCCSLPRWGKRWDGWMKDHKECFVEFDRFDIFFFDIVSNSEMIIINPRLWKGYSLTFRQKVTCYQYAWTHQYLFRLSQASLPGMGAVTALGSQHLGNLGTWQDSGFTMAIALLNDTVHYGQSDVNQSDSSCSSQDQTMTSGGIHDKRVCVTQNISEFMFGTTFLAYHCIPVQQFALHRLPV